MELFCRSNFPTDALKIFILSLVIASLKAIELKQIEGIEGTVTDLEFDGDGNIYGVANSWKIKNHTEANTISSTFSKQPSFMFKLDADRKILWKIRFNSGATRILINQKNDVYLLIERKEVIEVYTPAINKGVTILVKIFESLSWPKIDQVFVIDDSIIMVCFTDKESTIRVVKANSGQWSTVASNEGKDSFHVAKDSDGNVYFAEKYHCDVFNCALSESTSTQQLYILTKDSFKTNSPKPRIIQAVKNSTEIVISLTVNEENELYIHLYDRNSSHIKIKKMTGDSMKTILSRHGKFSAIQTFKNGAVIKLVEVLYREVDPVPFTDDSSQGVYYGTSLLHLTENGTVEHLRDYIFTVREKNTKPNLDHSHHYQYKLLEINGTYYFYHTEDEPSVRSINSVNALSDTEGNIYFECSEQYRSVFGLHLHNHNKQINVKIKFEPNADYFNDRFRMRMLLDGKENVWILSKKYLPASDQDILFFLRKGTIVAEKIASFENILEIRKSPKQGDVFVATDSGLFIKSYSNETI